jgi:hypothetical protein
MFPLSRLLRFFHFYNRITESFTVPAGIHEVRNPVQWC